MPRFVVTAFCILPLALTACSGSDSNSGSKEPPPSSPTGTAYAALTAGETEKVVDMIGLADESVAKDATDGRSTFYSGLMRLWQIGDKLALPANAVELLTESQTMVDRLKDARALLPDDDRAPGFYGLASVEVGKTIGNTTLVTDGLAALDDGIAIFPAYTHFLRGLVSVDSPADSDDFATVLEHFQAVADTCRFTKDSSGVFEYREGTLPNALRVCNDEGIVPHVLEGFFVEYGDALLKAGKSPEEARAMYQSAARAPRFDQWPFAAELQDRIDGADERAVLYADSDTTNDPTLWNQGGHLCIGCHQDHP
jgi:hypothetical protein